ncbi:MAG: DNA translocase FtsK 4TM domain-containing protein [SAR324 cluster bacterium]|nr:DNA translocase FtsK 4TM domain-containing protein [SAR324 cluster bacterium]
MTARTSKLFVSTTITVLLTLSLISADFYDPTLFHQLYPAGGIRNWCGILGALTGGTLVELFGTVSLLIPWFVLKISYSTKRILHRFSICYYAVILILSISIAQALWWPFSPSALSDSAFLFYPGYTGLLGVEWILQSINFVGASLLIGAICLFCTFKLFEELPFKLMLIGIFNSGVLVPVFLTILVRQKIIFTTFFQWMIQQINFLKISSKHRSYLDSIFVSNKPASKPEHKNQELNSNGEESLLDSNSLDSSVNEEQDHQSCEQT